MPEWPDISRITKDLPEVFRKFLSGRIPSPAQFVQEHLTALGVVEAIILVAVGVIFLIYGWQAFRLLIIANAAFVGGLGGAHLAAKYVGPDMALFGLIGGGLLLAVLSISLIRYAVGVAGGVAGGYVGYHVWPKVVEALNRPAWAENAWVGSLIGLMVLGLICFLAFRLIVMVLTSVEGGMLTVSGVLALCLHHAAFSEKLRGALVDHRFVLPVLFVIPSVIGFALQYNAWRKPPPSEGGKKAGVTA